MKKYCITYGESKNEIIGRDFYNTYEEADAVRHCVLGLYKYLVIEELPIYSLIIGRDKNEHIKRRSRELGENK